MLAQNKPGAQVHIKRAVGEIKLDGILDEADWEKADVAKDWYLNFPVDSAAAPYQTEARLTFDDQYLYVSFVAYDDSTRDVINSLRRDFDYDRNDNVGFNIGPYNDRLNGFFFVLTPAGVQMEGTIATGGASDDSWNIYWDNKWYSKVLKYEDKWVAEAAIPFKSFRYKSNIKEWNISFDRLDKKRNHKSAWIHTPIQFATGAFAYSGQLIWDDPVPPARTNISFIPFIAGRLTEDKHPIPPDKEKVSDVQVGFDAKVSVTPSLNLDLTVNPDFSQVEVDQQVINLTRFEFLYPERRTFFLENSDLMSQAGFPPARTFFSRRIGLVKDNSGLYTRVPIQYGARLSGSINPKWRINLMNMQTGDRKDVGLPTQNYSIATIQRNFWKQSNIAITYADKESLGVGAGDSSVYFHETVFVQKGASRMRSTFNRVLTGDLELLSYDNKWSLSGYASKVFDPFKSDNTGSAGLFGSYNVRKFNFQMGHYHIEKNYNAEMGFVPSYGVYPGQNAFLATAVYKLYPKNKAVFMMGPRLDVQNNYIPGGTLIDKLYSAAYEWRFLNTTQIKVSYNYVYQRMTNAFNPVGGEKTFNEGEVYDWSNIMLTFQSNVRRLVNTTFQSSYGGFYNGTNFNFTGQLNYRYQPYGNVSMRVDYNDVRLKGEYGTEKLFLVGPRVDLTLTDKIFLTTYLQYNNLLDNVNLNARFQWRYKPASDFFIVYTENYLPSTFGSKNRALVFKFTYWFNL